MWQNASANVTLLRNTTLMFYHAFDVSRRDADGGALLLEIGVDADSAPPEVYMKKGDQSFPWRTGGGRQLKRGLVTG